MNWLLVLTARTLLGIERKSMVTTISTVKEKYKYRYKKQCPLCEFQKSTEWYYWDKWKGIIICRDKRDLNFKYRILAVRAGKEHHKPIPMNEERNELLVPLVAVASAHVRNGRASGYDIDEQPRSVPQHYHCQANMY